MCNNCNCGWVGLLNLFSGNGRSTCGGSNGCGCYDEYYAMQYGLSNNGCGRSDWYNHNTDRSGCGCSSGNSGWNGYSNSRSGGCGCRRCNN